MWSIHTSPRACRFWHLIGAWQSSTGRQILEVSSCTGLWRSPHFQETGSLISCSLTFHFSGMGSPVLPSPTIVARRVKAKRRNACPFLAPWSHIASSCHGSSNDRPASFLRALFCPFPRPIRHGDRQILWLAPSLCQIVSFAASARPQVRGNPASRPLKCFPPCTPTHRRIGCMLPSLTMSSCHGLSTHARSFLVRSHI